MKHHDAGRYADAEPLYRQAFEIHENLGGNHSEHAVTLNNLALLLKQTGRYAESGPHLWRLLEICRSIFPERHPGYATALHNLGEWCRVMRRYDEAEPFLRQALKIRHAISGDQDDDYLKNLGSLGLLLTATRRFVQAEPLLVRVVEIRRVNSGEQHPSYAKALSNLAVLRRDAGRHAEAEALLRRALEIVPDDATALNNLGLLALDTGRYAEAEARFLHVLEIDRAAGRERHPDYAIALNNLALARAHLVVEIRRETLGEQHPSYLTALDILAALQRDTGRQAEAVHSPTRQAAASAPEGIEVMGARAFEMREKLEHFRRIGEDCKRRGDDTFKLAAMGKMIHKSPGMARLYVKEISEFFRDYFRHTEGVEIPRDDDQDTDGRQKLFDMWQGRWGVTIRPKGWQAWELTCRFLDLQQKRQAALAWGS